MTRRLAAGLPTPKANADVSARPRTRGGVPHRRVAEDRRMTQTNRRPWAAAMGAAPATATTASPAPTTTPAPSAVPPDPGARDGAGDGLRRLPFNDLPVIEAAADRDDLPPEAAARLHRLLPAVRQRAKVARRSVDERAANSAFARVVALAAYDQDGHANLKRDADARAFLAVVTGRGEVVGRAELARTNAARRHGDAALAAGCDDPDVLAYAALLAGQSGRPAADVAAAYARADAAAKGGRVGPVARVIVDGWLLRAAVPGLQAQAAAYGLAHPGKTMRFPRAVVDRFDDMVRCVEQVIRTPGVPDSAFVRMADDVFDRAADLKLPRGVLIKNFIDPVQAYRPNDAAALHLKWTAYVRRAWEARGSGYAGTVTPQGEHDMADRLAVASDALTRSWQLDPDNPRAATEMRNVELGQGRGKDVLELWVARALATDPDCYPACTAKLLYLEPKWYGSAEQTLAWGHQCVDAGNWHSYQPLILSDAHERLAGYEADPAGYFLKPGVWDDLRAVYDGYARHLTTPALRSAYASFACRCHRWRAADEHFRLLGDAVDPSKFGDGSAAAGADARRTAARLAGANAAQGK